MLTSNPIATRIGHAVIALALSAAIAFMLWRAAIDLIWSLVI